MSLGKLKFSSANCSSTLWIHALHWQHFSGVFELETDFDDGTSVRNGWIFSNFGFWKAKSSVQHRRTSALHFKSTFFTVQRYFWCCDTFLTCMQKMSQTKAAILESVCSIHLIFKHLFKHGKSVLFCMSLTSVYNTVQVKGRHYTERLIQNSCLIPSVVVTGTQLCRTTHMSLMNPGRKFPTAFLWGIEKCTVKGSHIRVRLWAYLYHVCVWNFSPGLTSIEINNMSIFQSVECPLTVKDTVIIGGNLQVRNGTGSGAFLASWRRLTSDKGWMEVRLRGFRLHLCWSFCLSYFCCGERAALNLFLSRACTHSFCMYIIYTVVQG